MVPAGLRMKLSSTCMYTHNSRHDAPCCAPWKLVMPKPCARAMHRCQAAAAGGRALLARRGAGAPLQNMRAAAGVSAFAYQGTNAHAVLGGPEPAARALAVDRELSWQPRRFWFQARCMPMDYAAQALHEFRLC